MPLRVQSEREESVNRKQLVSDFITLKFKVRKQLKNTENYFLWTTNTFVQLMEDLQKVLGTGHGKHPLIFNPITSL